MWIQLSMKAPVGSGNFPPQVIGQTILTTSEKWVIHVNKIQHRKEGHAGFYVETLNREKSRGGGGASL